MRVPYALAAVAALAGLVYGCADPLNSALTAATRAKSSSAAAVTAAEAARVKVKMPPKPRPVRLAGPLLASVPHRIAAPAGLPATGVHPPVAHASQLSPAPGPTAPHASQSSLGSSRRSARPRATSRRVAHQHRSAPAHLSGQPARSISRPRPAPRVISAEEHYGRAAEQEVTVSRLSTEAGRRPTVYFVHGGSWVAGGQGEWAAEAHRWASKGWTAVNISYRLDVQGQYMLHDVRSAVSQLERRPYVDPGRQIIVGSSAGAHLAASVAVRYPQEFRGVIAWSPVISPQVAAAGAQAASSGIQFRLALAARRLWGSNWRAASPVSYVTDDSPPLWAAAARGEWLRWSDQGALLCQALGDRCTATIVPGRAHGAQLANSHAELRNQALRWASAHVS